MAVRPILVAISLVATSFAVFVPSASACHETAAGCLRDCATYNQGAYSGPDDDCADKDHAIGVVKGVVVRGAALVESAAGAAVVAKGGDTRQGYVQFRFEWEDPTAPHPTPVEINVKVEGRVDYESDDTGNLTFTASDNEMTLTFPFTVSGDGHRHIPFTVRGNTAGGSEETVEGVFTVPADKDRDGGFWTDEVAGRYWYWLLLIALLALLLGMLLERRRRTLAPLGLPPLAA